MTMRTIDPCNEVIVPMYELAEDGSILANPIFHRPWDKLHSRCIEYPYAASKIGNAERILDVGTAKADNAWVSWLKNLPIEVHATDFDSPDCLLDGIEFHQCDVRDIPLPDAMFDKILAVSVIEHIGLESPQVISSELPVFGEDGDRKAVEELARLLKPGGELVMTFPFGPEEGLILGNEARNYTKTSIAKFGHVLEEEELHYYEYQHRNKVSFYKEFSGPIKKPKLFSGWNNKRILAHRVRNSVPDQNDLLVDEKMNYGKIPGLVTWRRIPLSNSNAQHHGHVEGVICGVWRKS